MGYSGANKDFHSFRRTVITELHNAEVPEPTAAAIVGHKIQTMSYGLYSGGLRMDVLTAAIEKLEYPFNG